MSQANVELVRRLVPPPGTDLALLVRDDKAIAAAIEAASPDLHPHFRCSTDWGGGEGATYEGADGLRALWLDWLTPWTSYRSQTEEIVDLGERVVVLVRDYGRRRDTDFEIEVMAASIWLVRDGKIASVEFYARREDALEAVGLRG